MATIKTISATYERKVNLGDYNSVHIGMTLWAELDEGDNEGEIGEGLRQMARNHVMVEMARLVPSLAVKVQDVVMGLPISLREEIVANDN
jgi:hypothetical protein